MQIAVVILNWNGKKYLEKFLPALFENTNPDLAEIIVADNASKDDSIAFLKENYPNTKRIILDENYGFAGGYNKALAQLKHKYYLLLNSDVEVTPNWIEPLYDLMENDKQVYACQPKLNSFSDPSMFEYAGAAGGLMDKYGFAFCRGRVFNTTEKDEGQHDSPLDVFWATGASLMVRSDMYWKAGGLDDDFFAHMEEIDLCWRLKLLGGRVVCEPKSVVYHVGGGTLDASNPFKTYLNFRNNLSILYKNLPDAVYRKRILVRKILDGIAAVRFLTEGKMGDVKAVFRAHMHHRKLKKTLLEKRKQFNDTDRKRVYKDLHNSSVVVGYFIKHKELYKDYCLKDN